MYNEIIIKIKATPRAEFNSRGCGLFFCAIQLAFLQEWMYLQISDQTTGVSFYPNGTSVALMLFLV